VRVVTGALEVWPGKGEAKVQGLPGRTSCIGRVSELDNLWEPLQSPATDGEAQPTKVVSVGCL